MAGAIANVGLILNRKGVYAEAESLHRAALGIQLRVLGENHPVTAGTMQNLAHAGHALAKSLAAQGRTAEALPLLAQLVKTAEAQFGETSARTGEVQLTYGTALGAEGR